MYAWLLLVTVLVMSEAMESNDVVAVVILFRHGDRTPIDPYPNDPYKDPKYWPVPYGQLTDKGKKQHYQLGTEFRKRYGHLLKDSYDPNQIYVRSTDTDRTLISALTDLAGLYPVNNNSQEFISGLAWQPIPVHTIPEYKDEVLAMKAPCPMFTQEREKLLNTDYFKKINANNLPIYRYVTKFTGRNVMDMVQASYIYDVLYIEELYNYTLPEWTHQVYPHKLKEITKMSFKLDTFTPELTRLKIGPLLKEITEHLVGAVSESSKYKMWIYSCHDTTIAALMNGLNFDIDLLIPYAGHVMIELLANNSVRVINQNEVVAIPNCGMTCPLVRWISNFSHLIPKNHTEDCYGIEASKVTINTDWIIYSLVAIIILLILVNVSIFVIMRRWILVLQFK